MGNYATMAGMMSGGGSTAPIPTQTFNSANFIGTPVPQVGDNAGRPSYASAVGAPDPKVVVFVAVAFIGIGYLVYHLNFEK